MSFEQKLADAIQRVIAPVKLEDGDAEGIVLQNYVIVSDWQALDGTRGVHIAWGENQPSYITKALLSEGLTMADEQEEEDAAD